MLLLNVLDLGAVDSNWDWGQDHQRLVFVLISRELSSKAAGLLGNAYTWHNRNKIHPPVALRMIDTKLRPIRGIQKRCQCF